MTTEKTQTIGKRKGQYILPINLVCLFLILLASRQPCSAIRFTSGSDELFLKHEVPSNDGFIRIDLDHQINHNHPNRRNLNQVIEHA